MSRDPGASPFPFAGPVVVVGLGVMGGSVTKSVRCRAPQVPVFGVETDSASAELAARDGVNCVAGLQECPLNDAVLVLATPLDVTVSLLDRQAGLWSRARLVTDLASLKAPVMQAASRSGRARFVGAHPMCGSERSGYAAARAGLFDESVVWLCPGPREQGEGALEDAASFWRWLGGSPREVSPVCHDRTMSWASHLPQLVSSALAGALKSAGFRSADLGPGGRDMTRLSASGAEMWIPLLLAAAREDAKALKAVESEITSIRRALEARDSELLAEVLQTGRQWLGGEK